MKFMQPCFIRKNTQELRKKLEELGYPAPSEIWHDESFAICTFYRDNECEYFTFEIDDDFERNITPYYPFVDCGTNEELFLALSALRDDFSENQWFVMDVEVYNNISKGEWFLSTDQQGGKHVGTQIEPLYCHKATVKEILEHFKTE